MYNRLIRNSRLSLNYDPLRRELMNTNTTVVTILSSYYCDLILFFTSVRLNIFYM